MPTAPDHDQAASASALADAPFLIGEYELTVDDKNRLLVPSEVRKQIDTGRDGEALIIVLGSNRKPWLYPENYYRKQIAPRHNTAAPGDAVLKYTLATFGLAHRVVPDKQGRVLMPDKTLRRTNTGKEVVLLGVGNHLQLWNRDDWERYNQELTNNLEAIATKYQQEKERLA